MLRRGTLIGLLAVGCGGGFKPELYNTPQSLYDAAMAEYQNGNCGRAAVGFERLAVDLPARDPRAAEVRFLLAECRLDDGQYLESAREFRRVADEYSDHEFAPRALLRAGDALARLWKRAELDPSQGQSAMSTYSELLRRYPQSDAALEARDRATELADRFALKDLKTGEFYERLRAFDSAIIYYKAVVAGYPQSLHAPTALVKLVRIYRRIGYEEEATETCDHLRRFFPTAEGVAAQCPAPSAS